MRDLRRYVLLMELKCAKRHVKSDGLYRPETVPARFYRASKRESVACGRSLAIRGVEYVSRESTPKWFREAHENQFVLRLPFFFFISIAIGARSRSAQCAPRQSI